MKPLLPGSHCALLAEILRDGEWHSSREILQATIARTGEGMTVHSRVSDLRKRYGFVVARDRVPGERGARAYRYRLLDSPRSGSDGVVNPDVTGSASIQVKAPGEEPQSPDSRPVRRPEPVLSFCTLCAHEITAGEECSPRGEGFAHDRCIGLDTGAPPDSAQLSLTEAA